MCYNIESGAELKKLSVKKTEAFFAINCKYLDGTVACMYNHADIANEL